MKLFSLRGGCVHACDRVARLHIIFFFEYMYYNHRFSQFHTQNIDISKAFLSNGDEQLQINPIRCVN